MLILQTITIIRTVINTTAATPTPTSHAIINTTYEEAMVTGW